MVNMQELSETNKNLSAALTNLQAQIQILEEKLNKTKPFKRMIKSCNGLSCTRCNKLVQVSGFLVHIEKCSARVKESLTPTGKSPYANRLGFNVTLDNVYQVNPEEKITPRTIFFILTVTSKAGRNTNTIKRNFSSLLNLIKILVDVYPRVDMPPNCQYILEHPKELMNSRKFSLIQKSLNELGNHEIYKNSAPFLSYLEIDNKTNNYGMSPFLDNTPSHYDQINEVKTHSIEDTVIAYESKQTTSRDLDTSIGKLSKGYDPFVRRHSSFTSKEMNLNSSKVDLIEDESPKKFVILNPINPETNKAFKPISINDSSKVSKR
jgi:hypothetical protein